MKAKKKVSTRLKSEAGSARKKPLGKKAGETPASTPLDPLRILPPITEKQGKCLQFIWDYLRENRYYPTQREVAKAMNVQSNTAEMYLQPLEQKGYLQREPHKQRNIRLTNDALEKLAMLGIIERG